MSLERKKKSLERKIERQRSKTLLRETKLKGKISAKKELLSLERQLEDAKTLSIPKKDKKVLKLILKQEEKSFKTKAKKSLIALGKWLGKAFNEWVERSRAEKEAYRKQMEKKDDN